MLGNNCLDSFVKKEVYPLDNNILKESIEYFEKNIQYGKDILKKIFIIDTRKLSERKIKYIFDNFEEVQKVILSKYFFDYIIFEKTNNKSVYPFNIELIFLINDKEELNINKHDYLYNMNYALKSFMTEKELVKYIESMSFVNVNKEQLLELKQGITKISHFNYIYGNNATGKSKMLEEISSKLNVPLFSMNEKNYALKEYINDTNSLNEIIFNLTGSNNIDSYSSYGKYIDQLSQIIEYCKEHNNPILLDDLRWKSLDSRNYIKLLNTLADYSYKNNPVIITGSDQSQIIKRKVYNPKIISTNSKSI